MIRTLWSGGLIYAAGSILSRSLALLLLPLVTRVLAPADFGALEVIVTCGVLVNLVVPLETSQALARLWNERDDTASRRRLASTAWTFTLLSYTAFAAACALGAMPIAEAVLGDARHAPAMRAGGCAIALNGVFYLLQNQFRWELRPLRYVVVSAIYAFANLLLVATFALGLDAGLDGVLWAQAAAATCAASVSLFWLRGSLALRIDRAELADMLRFSLPLVPAGVAMFANFYVNRLMLNAMATLEDVGLFGLASRLSGAATIVLVGVQSALTPLIYAHHREPQTPVRLARLFETFSALALFFCLGLTLFARELVLLVATPSYVDAAPLLVWLAPAALFAQMYIFAPGIAIGKKTHWQLAISAFSAVAAISLNWLLIPRAGATGAALGTFLGASLFLATWLAASQRLYPLPLRWPALTGGIVLFAAVAVVGSTIDGYFGAGAAAHVAKALLLVGFGVAAVGIGLLRVREWRAEFTAST
jgi:O-antigen/teichoic acid export membrane protein